MCIILASFLVSEIPDIFLITLEFDMVQNAACLMTWHCISSIRNYVHLGYTNPCPLKSTLIELKEEKELQKEWDNLNIYIKNHYFGKYLCWQEYHGFDYGLHCTVHNPFHCRVTPIFTGLPHVLFQVQEQGEGAGLGSCHRGILPCLRALSSRASTFRTNC